MNDDVENPFIHICRGWMLMLWLLGCLSWTMVVLIGLALTDDNVVRARHTTVGLSVVFQPRFRGNL